MVLTAHPTIGDVSTISLVRKALPSESETSCTSRDKSFPIFCSLYFSVDFPASAIKSQNQIGHARFPPLKTHHSCVLACHPLVASKMFWTSFKCFQFSKPVGFSILNLFICSKKNPQTPSHLCSSQTRRKRLDQSQEEEKEEKWRRRKRKENVQFYVKILRANVV